MSARGETRGLSTDVTQSPHGAALRNCEEPTIRALDIVRILLCIAFAGSDECSGCDMN